VDSSSLTVFQVRSERQGDIARAHFYFAVRYDRSIDAREEAVLRQWHENDPVVGVGETAPSREQIRNDRIEDVQNNRNPFVDCPALVDRISNF
jgi:endonuclease I